MSESCDPALVAEVPGSDNFTFGTDSELEAYNKREDREGIFTKHEQKALKPSGEQSERPRVASVEKQFQFLSLPAEIRIKIFRLVTQSPHHYQRLGTDATEMPNYPASLLLANVQVHNEAKSLFYKENIFSITITRHPSTNLHTFLSPNFQDNRRLIQSMRICIVRWGPKDFFQESFAPLIEDMILRGSLRNLEVLIKDCQLYRRLPRRNSQEPNKSPAWASVYHEQKSAKEGDANWEALCGILRDPYLERVEVRAGPLELFGDDDEGEQQKKFEDVTRYFRLTTPANGAV